MSVQVILTFDSVQAAQVALSKLSGTVTEAQPEKSAGKSVKTDKAAASPPTASAPAPATAAPAPAPASAKKYEDTEIPALIDKGAKTKRPEVAALLKKFGAVTEEGKPKGVLLKPEQYEQFEAEIKALIADEDGM